MDIRIDCSRQLGPLTRFWCSTGFAPASLLNNEDMRQNMAYVGAVPYGGLSHVRVGGLLDLVSARDSGNGRASYDFTALHEALDVLVSNGLKCMIELTGSGPDDADQGPADFRDDTQLKRLGELVASLARHLIKRYGDGEVRTWYFLTCPTSGQDAEAFCNYYDACRHGLTLADEQLKLGGPGTSAGLSEILKVFLAHCETGANRLSPAAGQGVQLDFICVREDVPTGRDAPCLSDICRGQTEVFEYVREHHPRLAGIGFMNVRCSLRSSDAESDWRGGPFEAALTAGAVAQHLRAIVDEQACRFALMSCENAHTGGWGGHTLTARFASSEDTKSEQQAPRHFELVAKPVLNAVAMMSRLGPTRIKTSGADADDADIGAIATRLDKAQIAILLYNCSASPAASGPDEVQLQLTNLPMPEAMVARYAVDPEHCNPQDLWRRMNCPSAPTAEQLAQLRDEAQIAMPDAPQQVQTEGGSLSLEVPLPPASVSLVLITAQPDNPPEQITGLRGVRYRGLEDTGQVMLSWTALGSPTIRTHKILRASCAEGPYEPICHGELFCSAFLDANAGKDERWYKVQAMDFWGRTGQAANITVP